MGVCLWIHANASGPLSLSNSSMALERSASKRARDGNWNQSLMPAAAGESRLRIAETCRSIKVDCRPPRHRWSTALWTRVLLGVAGMHTGTLESSGCLDVRFRRRWGGRACPPRSVGPPFARFALRRFSSIHSLPGGWCRVDSHGAGCATRSRGGCCPGRKKGTGDGADVFGEGRAFFLKHNRGAPLPPTTRRCIDTRG